MRPKASLLVSASATEGPMSVADGHAVRSLVQDVRLDNTSHGLPIYVLPGTEAARGNFVAAAGGGRGRGGDGSGGSARSATITERTDLTKASTNLTKTRTDLTKAIQRLSDRAAVADQYYEQFAKTSPKQLAALELGEAKMTEIQKSLEHLRDTMDRASPHYDPTYLGDNAK